MKPTESVKFKKGRDAARQALNKAVIDLATKYELTAYEVVVVWLTTPDRDLKVGRLAMGTDNGRAEFDDVTVTAL